MNIRLICHFMIVRIALLIFALLAASTAHGQLMIVSTTYDLMDFNLDDDVCETYVGTCSLRAAIMQANHWHHNKGGLVIIVPAGTYKLSGGFSGDDERSGDLNITAPGNYNQIYLSGDGAERTIIDGNYLSGVLAVGAQSFLTVDGITIRGGANNYGAGGVLNAGTLTIDNSIVENNFGAYGGGIYSSGSLFVYNSTIRSNSANGGGGGVLNGGSLVIYGSFVENNSAAYGGGLYSSSGSLSVSRSTIRSNSANASGAGIYVEGLAWIRDSTISGNSATSGGGIGASVHRSGNPFLLYVVNSTISSNTAIKEGGGISAYGGIALYNTSVVHNKANSQLQGAYVGGGIYAQAGSRFAVVNTLMARNSAGFDTNNDCVGTLEAYGVNLVGDPTSAGCTTTHAALGAISLSTLDANLRDNGGPTLTHALLVGSEAIDATNNQACVDETGTPLATDQRGVPRIADARCDVGAFEFGAVLFKTGFDQ